MHNLTGNVNAHAKGARGSIAAWNLATRSGVSRSWRSAVVLAALFGITAGLAVAALTTADRVESSYEKLLTETDAPDVMASCFDCSSPEDADNFTLGLMADPAINHVAVLQEVYPILYTADDRLLGPFENECDTGAGELSATPPTWARSETPPVRLISGRLPSAGAANEIALPLITAERAGVAVGDQLSVTGVCHIDQFEDGRSGDEFEVHTLSVVGIFVGFADVRPAGQAEYFEVVLVDQAFGQAIGVESQHGGVLFWYEDGVGINDLGEQARSSIFIDMSDREKAIGDRLRPDVTALRILAALGALAAVAVLGQLLARHLRLLAIDHSTLRALGTTRRQLFGLGASHATLIGFAAGIIGGVVAVSALPFIPTGAGQGILKGAERTPPVLALTLGAAITVGVVVLLGVVPSWLTARATRGRGTATRQSVASRLVGDGRLGTTASWGVRVALEPAGGQQPVPVRSGLSAAVIATAVIAGVVTFAAGLEHLRATPRLVGWNWDFAAGGDDVDLQALARFASDHPDVERSSLGTIFPSSISVGAGLDIEVIDLAFDTGHNAITPVVLAGRAPEGADELVLNADIAEQLGVTIGDEVAVSGDDFFAFLHQVLGVATDLPDRRTTSFELVGIAVLPIVDGRFDKGMSLTLEGLGRIFAPASRDEIVNLLIRAEPARLYDVLTQVGLWELADEIRTADDTVAVIHGWSDEQLAPLSQQVGPHAVFVDLVDGADRAAVANDFARSGLLDENSIVIGILPDGTAISTTELVALNLDDVAWIPAGMGILMAITTLAVLAHLIASGARARRRDIATLRALGLVGSQARAIIAWQALTLVVVTSLLALPVGVVAGRYAWRVYAEGLGVVPEPVTPWAPLAALMVGLVVAHLLAALLPGRAAARMQPVAALRSE